MTYFTLGPVEMDIETLRLSAQQLPYFRDESFSHVQLDIVRCLKKFLYTDDSTKIAMLTASGTAAMEAALLNLFNRKDKLLIINGGSFGRRFVDICHRHGIPYQNLIVEESQKVDKLMLSAYADKDVTGVLINVHETSNGRYYPLKEVSDFSREQGATLVVDAISSFMADPYTMDAWGVDVTIFSSHKSLAVAPGLSFVAVNQSTWAQRRGKGTPPVYLDFAEHVKQGERGQTPFTPAVSVMLQLHDKLLRIEKNGSDNYIGDVKRRCDFFRKHIESLPIALPEYQLSNALTPVIFDGIDAYHVYEKLRDDYNIVVNPCGGEMANKMLRIGHMGNLSLDDNRCLINALEEVLTA